MKRTLGGERTDKETKDYIDSEILRMGQEIETTFRDVRRDMDNVQKRLKKLEED